MVPNAGLAQASSVLLIACLVTIRLDLNKFYLLSTSPYSIPILPMAAALIADLHAELIRNLSEYADFHFQGLSQASRSKHLPLTPQLRRQLAQLDIAHNICRHITHSGHHTGMFRPETGVPAWSAVK